MRNAKIKMPKNFDGPKKVYYVEIVRHAKGEEAKIRDWIDGRAYYAEEYKVEETWQMIRIESPNIG